MNKSILLSNYKNAIIYALVVCCIVAVVYSKFFAIEAVFTHLFFPIVMAGIWFRRKGIFVALLLVLVLIASDIMSYGFTSAVLLRDIMRGAIFCIVALVVGQLSGEIHRHKQEAVNHASSLEETVASGTRELEETKDYLHNIFYSMPVGIVAMDTDMCITGFNRAAENHRLQGEGCYGDAGIMKTKEQEKERKSLESITLIDQLTIEEGKAASTAAPPNDWLNSQEGCVTSLVHYTPASKTDRCRSITGKVQATSIIADTRSQNRWWEQHPVPEYLPDFCDWGTLER